MEQIDYIAPERHVYPGKRCSNAYTKNSTPRTSIAIEDHLLLHTTWNNELHQHRRILQIHKDRLINTLFHSAIRMDLLTSNDEKYYAYICDKYRDINKLLFETPVITLTRTERQ